MTFQDVTPSYQIVSKEDHEHAAGSSSPGFGVRILMLLSWVFMIIMNAITGPANAKTSAEYPTRITPAGYAFLIWNVLFLGTGAFAGYALVNRGPTNPLPRRVVALFVSNMVLNGLWGYVFTHKYAAGSVMVIVGVLLTSIELYKAVFPNGASAFPEWTVQYWCRQFAWSAYTAWLVVASLVNIEWAQLYYNFFVSNTDQNVEGVVFITAAVLVGAYWALARQDVVALSVLLWSFIAILVKQSDYQCIFIAAIVASVAVFALALYTVLRHVLTTKA